MLKKIAFTCYPVTDLARARKFYEEILGLKPGSHAEKWCEYDLPGGGCFSLTDFGQGKPSSEAGGTVAFEVDDIAALVADLKSKNIEVKMDIMQTPVCRMAAIVDSEGNGVLLHQLNQK